MLMTCELVELVAAPAAAPSPAGHHHFVHSYRYVLSCIIEFLNHEVSNEVHDKGKEDCYPYKVKDI